MIKWPVSTSASSTKVFDNSDIEIGIRYWYSVRWDWCQNHSFGSMMCKVSNDFMV